MKFLSEAIIDFRLYHCNLFIGVTIKVYLFRYMLSDEFVRMLKFYPFMKNKKRCCKNEFCNTSYVYNTTSSKIGVQ